jgi:recombination protein RecA
MGVRIVGSGRTRQALRQLGLLGKRSWEKRVPEPYLYASVEQRLALVQGLLDSDGHVPKEGIAEYSSSSETLAANFAFLVRSLGGFAVGSDRIPVFSDANGERKQGRRACRVHVRFRPDITPVRSVKHLGRWGRRESAPLKSIAAIEPLASQECQCIRVANEDGLYVTDGFTLTHNSTLVDQSMAQVQRMGGIAALIDSETARDEGYTATLGVDIDELIVHPATTIEEVFDGVDMLLDLQEKVYRDTKGNPPIMLIVWDAIGGTQTEAEKKGKPDDSHVGVAARNIKQNFRRICLRLAKLRATLLCCNHFYQQIGGFGGLSSYGGSGIRYFSSLRIWLTRGETIKVGDVAVGHGVKAKIKKTRIGKPLPPVEAGLIWGSGFDNAYTLFTWGLTAGVNEAHRWIVRHGSWYYLMRPDGTHEGFQRGFAGLGAILQEHPAIYAQMAEQYLRGD